MPPRQVDGRRIRAVRRAAGLMAEDFAARISVTKTAVLDWETGKSAPKPERLGEIAERLGQDIDTMFPRWGPPTLADLRSDAGYTQGDAATALNINRRTLGNAETGKQRLKPDLLRPMADLYKVSVEDLKAAEDLSFGVVATTPAPTQAPRTLAEKIRFLLQNRPQSDDALAAAINAKARADIVQPQLIEALRTEVLPADKLLEGLPMSTVFEGLAEAFQVEPFFFQSDTEVEQDLVARLRFLSLLRSGDVSLAARGGEGGVSPEMLELAMKMLLDGSNRRAR